MAVVAAVSAGIPAAAVNINSRDGRRWLSAQAFGDGDRRVEEHRLVVVMWTASWHSYDTSWCR